MPIPTDTLARVADLTVDFTAPSSSGIDPDELLARQRQLARIRRRIDAWSTSIAAEIAALSRPELGHRGLAQQLGARTPEALVQQLTGARRGEARVLVRSGQLLDAARADPAGQGDAAGFDPGNEWMRTLGAEVASGSISIDAADAIRSGLGEPGDALTSGAVDRDAVERAMQQLLREAQRLTPERLAARARELRDEMDAAGVADRAAVLRERRFLHLTPLPDGMTRLSGLLDPESAAVITAAVDAATSPRRGGPRFVHPDEQARAATLEGDARTTPQIALDTVVALVSIATDVDPRRLLGSRRPAVQLVVAERDLRQGTGAARLDGQTASVGVATASRYACVSGVVPIAVDDGGNVAALGSPQRLFTARQRAALSVRDGGCRFGDCPRPPSWCEAHHIVPWSRGGPTDVANGILLCRHHHLLVHDEGWRIERRAAEFDFIPPEHVDRQRRLLPSRGLTPVVARALGMPTGRRQMGA